MDRHIAALRATADAVPASDEGPATGDVASVANATALLRVRREEEARRRAIINYTPQGDREAKMKLTYLAAYLIATGGTLTAKDMDSILETPRGRVSASTS